MLFGDLAAVAGMTFNMTGDKSENAVHGRRFQSRIDIPDFSGNIHSEYGKDAMSQNGYDVFPAFGITIEMEQPTEIHLFDGNDRLCEEVKALLRKFGALTLVNAYLPVQHRENCQRNIFPNLRFHYDRTPSQGNYFSLFFRDPFSTEHHLPRKSSTLITSNMVVILEAQRKGLWTGKIQPWYDLFKESDIRNLTNGILLEQTWTAPAGTGEITIVDNSSVMHASYYREEKGYPIGVRYLY